MSNILLKWKAYKISSEKWLILFGLLTKWLIFKILKIKKWSLFTGFEFFSNILISFETYPKILQEPQVQWMSVHRCQRTVSNTWLRKWRTGSRAKYRWSASWSGTTAAIRMKPRHELRLLRDCNSMVYIRREEVDIWSILSNWEKTGLPRIVYELSKIFWMTHWKMHFFYSAKLIYFDQFVDFRLIPLHLSDGFHTLFSVILAYEASTFLLLHSPAMLAKSVLLTNWKQRSKKDRAGLLTLNAREENAKVEWKLRIFSLC